MTERKCYMCRWIYINETNDAKLDTAHCAYNPPQVFANHDGKGWHTITLYPVVDQLENFCSKWELGIEE